MRIISTKLVLIVSAILLFAAQTGYAQLRVELNISPRPSTRLADWMSRRETASLLITNASERSTNVRIDAKLSLNGSLIASTKLALMPSLPIPIGGPINFYAADIFPENAVSFSGDLKATSMRSGMLPEGSYELCITLTDAETLKPVSSSVCRSFFLTKYIMPVLLQPEDNKKIASGTERTTFFVWTPIIPTPPAPVNYRLRVVEVLQGQSAQQALTVNNPLFERTTHNLTQLMWPQEIPLSGTGGNLAWAVQPEDESGNAIITPERFTTAFNLIVLPSKEECVKQLIRIKKLREEGLVIEEKYWESYERFAKITQSLEEAEERADALEIEKYKKLQTEADTKLEKLRTVFDTVRAKYDTAINEYESCIGK